MLSIGHLDIDEFFAWVERRENPALNGCALVIGGRPGATGFVAAVSAEAREQGVRPGITLDQAAALCPDAVFLEGDVDRYVSAAASVDEVVRFTCSLVEWTAVDQAFLNLSEGVQPGQQARQAIDRILKDLRTELGLEASIGLAGSRVAAQVASRLAGPDSLLFVLPGYERRFLASLDVDALPDLADSTIRRLRSKGFQTIGDVASVPVPALEAIVGPSASRLAAWAGGADNTRVRGAVVPRQISARAHVDPTNDLESIQDVVRMLVEQLAARLRARSLFAGAVRVRIETNHGAVGRSIALRHPSVQEIELLASAKALARRLVKPTDLIHQVQLAFASLVSCRGQLSLFPSEPLGGSGGRLASQVRTRPAFRSLLHSGLRPSLSPNTRRLLT